MACAVRVYTPAEAAALSNINLKAVHNAIDKSIVDTIAASDPAQGRALTEDGLVRLKLWHGVGGALPADRRQRLFDAIEADPSAPMVRADDFLIVDVAEARKQVADSIRTLNDANASIHRTKSVMGGEPVFKGTRIPVRMVVAMLGDGAERSEILDGYPNLTPRLLDLAVFWVAAHPQRGRPKIRRDDGYALKSTQSAPYKGDMRRGSVEKTDASE